ncbi:MAG: hypothetical protein IKW57_01925 [Alphaproteobacteria bacterium]|nr:hypothetical protein [Alphaproteobacteria bacterium]
MQKIKKTKLKHILYVALVVLLAGWVIFRFAAVASENARYVFNASRVAADQGMPVVVEHMHAGAGTLYEPLSVQNNRAYVSAERASKLHAGQRVGDGKIVSVSNRIDYDTGMYVVRTSGVSNGLQMAEFTANGYFVPLYAVNNNSVFVMVDDYAVSRPVDIARRDSETAYITSGLSDGDIVILSSVNAGDKVQIVK